MYITYYCKLCFSKESKWYYKLLKKDVSEFVNQYHLFKNNLSEQDKTRVSIMLEKYCKPVKPPINKKLRENCCLSQEDMTLIKVLDFLITKFKVQNKIILFRGSDIDVFADGDIYTEYGYMSTSLVKESIDFCHPKKFRYIILIPIGTCGFCPQVFTCRDIEYEYILPRNTKLQLINKRKRNDYVEIKCKLVI